VRLSIANGAWSIRREDLLMETGKFRLAIIAALASFFVALLACTPAEESATPAEEDEAAAIEAEAEDVAIAEEAEEETAAIEAEAEAE
jgi:ABC-type enterochelin transport system substrate-binding protein